MRRFRFTGPLLGLPRNSLGGVHAPSALAASILLLTAASLGAQTAVSMRTPDTYGGSQITLAIGAYEFTPPVPSTVLASGSGGSRYVSSGPTQLVAAVHLPNGASVFAMEIQGCDTSSSGNITATLLSETQVGGIPGTETETVLGTITPNTNLGCAFWYSAIQPVTIDNWFQSYVVLVTLGTTDSTNRFTAVRLFYNLQVSPAPATATFGDVPVGHPQHRFVEALVAAGITAGCGAGNYCPAAPITRGQMAVFLSVALGLHWPN